MKMTFLQKCQVWIYNHSLYSLITLVLYTIHVRVYICTLYFQRTLVALVQKELVLICPLSLFYVKGLLGCPKQNTKICFCLFALSWIYAYSQTPNFFLKRVDNWCLYIKKVCQLGKCTHWWIAAKFGVFLYL